MWRQHSDYIVSSAQNGDEYTEIVYFPMDRGGGGLAHDPGCEA